jgi:hypothetical protein
MAIITGFQQNATGKVSNYFPGDIIGGQTTATLGAEGYFAKDDCIIGNALFRASDEQSVASNATLAGTQIIAGINARNTGGSYMPWDASLQGYSYVTPAGSQPTAWIGGKIGALVTGVDATGAANHVSVIGEQIWVKLTDGSLASAPISIADVTGYVKADGLKIYATGGYNSSVTVGANQTLAIIAGNLLGA